MIDFRYHLVSIASVFLALAVGIVLGAGPLKGTISDTLTSEVTKLREDANTLRAELNAAESAVSARDDLIDELRPRSVAGVLAGKRVVIVALPGTSDATIDTARGAVDEAGATVGSALRLQPTWASEEPPDITDRDAAAGELRELLAGELPVGIAPDRVLSLALASALTGADPDPDAADEPGDGATDQPTEEPEGGSLPTGEVTSSPDDADEPTAADAVDGVEDIPKPESVGGRSNTSRSVLEILTRHGLIDVDGEEAPQRAHGIVLLAPQIDDADGGHVAGWIDLVDSLSELGAVLVGGDVPADAPLEANLVAAVRDNRDLAGQVSTVDNLDTPIGTAALPLALVAQIDGEPGHFGVLDTASALFPAVPAGAP